MDDARTAITELRQDAEQRIGVAGTLEELDRVELALLGRKQGALTAILRGLGTASPADRKSLGQQANEVKMEIERLIAEKRRAFERGRMANLAESEWIDVSAPGDRPPAGSPHPIARAITDITSIFERIGFVRARHPEVDSDYYAFEALNMPTDHPARDEWETFFVKTTDYGLRTTATVSDRNRSPSTVVRSPMRIVLTPHTSNGQVREMEKGALPIRMVNIGKCYRRQIDATHTPMFHQFEGLLVDRDVSVTHLKGTLDYFVQSYFGPDRRTRLRPYHFQFTEPSFEIDISCSACGGTGKRRTQNAERRTDDRCRTCKSGWLELGGAGMVHPNVLKVGGIDPSEYSGFAFGWGVERVLMMKAGINDIRLLYSNDLRYLQQV